MVPNETGREGYTAVHEMCKSRGIAETEAERLTKEVNTVRSKVFGFHSIRSVINCKVKNKGVKL